MLVFMANFMVSNNFLLWFNEKNVKTCSYIRIVIVFWTYPYVKVLVPDIRLYYFSMPLLLMSLFNPNIHLVEVNEFQKYTWKPFWILRESE